MTSQDQSKVLVLGAEPRVAARLNSGPASITAYGSPSINGRTPNDEQLSKLVDDPLATARSLDGEFIVIVEGKNSVQVVNDRFAAHQLFYLSTSEKLVIAFSYASLWKWLADTNQLKVDPLAFYEFLHFQRLIGETTFDQTSKALTPASILSFDSRENNLKTERYWTPNFDKRNDGRKAIANDLADAVTRSVATKTIDSTATSLLLSGGMDSRVALGGFNQDQLPHCITIGETENNEVDVAQSLAHLVGAKHSFVPRSPTHYTDILTTSVTAGGGMYSFQHGHFFDLNIPKTDLLLHGHGFDYYFQGMYLPATRNKFLGRSTRSYSLSQISPGIVGQYTQEAKYRLKGINSLDLLNSGTADEAMGRLVFDLQDVLDPISDLTSDPYDQWDYLTTSAPGRHYTYLNLQSAGTLAEQRTIAFSNEILDIYYATPANVRHGTTLLAETIKKLDPRLLSIRNANTNMRPDLSPTRLTLETWTRGLKRRLGVGGDIHSDPDTDDRSWPTGDRLLRSSAQLVDRVNQLGSSDQIESLRIFDMSKIKDTANRFASGNGATAPALLSLVTIDEFLKTT
ncbi:MAG: hypothetical protein HOF01_02635 [Chloroflexi bacterium]|mgnify:FL=1|jgi:hypothetical protein|nr:hypothetical protein [Chloroflexota bacterium]